MDALGIACAAVVGNSMGGEISAELAIAAPDRVRRLVLVSPAGISTANVQRRLPMIRRAYPAVHAAASWVGANADQLVRRPKLRAGAMSLVAARPRKIAAEFAAEQIRGMGKPGFLPALEAIVSHSQTLRERLPAIGCPTLVLWGEEDPVVPVRDAEVFASQIPGAHKIVWQDTGHVAMFERAAEFNALLEGFLSA
jgi:pimeloyl-ACP methyl ester carboxylesterase